MRNHSRVLPLLVGCCLVAISLGFSGDSAGRRSHDQKVRARGPVTPGANATFEATAYCDSGKTQSGVSTRSGVAAADPIVLPVGSVVRVTVDDDQYSGIYTIMDTGRAIKGRILDLFMRDCTEATAFARQKVRVQVLRRGWNPKASVKK